MKIAVFTTYFWPEKNGLVNYIDGLYTHVISNHHDVKVDIFTFDTLKTKIHFETIGSFNVYRFPCVTLMGGTYAIPSITSYTKLKKIFKKNTYHIVNTHTRFFLSSFFGYLIAKKYKIKFVHTEHGSSFVKDGSQLVRLLARVYDETLGRLVISQSDVLLGVSKKCLDFANMLSSKNKYKSVIHNGIDTNFWQLDKHKPTNQLIKITFCGRLTKSKGVHNLLTAMIHLESTNWLLDIVGAGNYNEYLVELSSELNINNKITWHGSVDSNYIKNILSNTDIFINPSYSEGLPTSVLEAGAMQCICIATDVGGTNEVIDDGINGFLIPPQNIEQLVDKLNLVMNKVEYKQFGIILSKKIKSTFDWLVISEKFYDILKMYSNNY
ncbi:MAG: glycosyltransferase family 4 protein [Spirochaetota bacterium]|nr:glycosyltransferase family 4 protein [Spirochaetota bacterium]